MIRTRTLCESALAISTICCWPMRRSRTKAEGSNGCSRRSQQFAGNLFLLSMLDDSSGDFAANEDVFGNAEIWEEFELLKNDPDPSPRASRVD